MSVEAKVGAFTIGGLIMLGAAIFGLGNFNLGSDGDFTVYAGFKQIIGLEPQAAVRLSGVPVGTVTGIANDGGGVTLTLDIKPDVKIPKNSVVGIASSGVMGEKFVNITPGKDNGEYLQNGDYVYGVDEAGMDSMFENMSKVMDKVEVLLNSVNKIAGNEDFQKSVVEMTENMKEASGHMSGLMESLEKVSKGNEENINQIISQMNSLLASMNGTMANVEHMTANMDKFAGDPQTAEDLKKTLANVAETSKNVASMAENMNKVMGDPQTAEDLKATISNARSLSEKADKMLGKISKVDVQPSVDILYSGGKSNWTAGVNLDLTTEKNSLNLGVEDIGNKSKLNAQVGARTKAVGARAGIIAGKPGIGADIYAGKNLKISAEAYDLNDARLRLKSQIKVADETYLIGEIRDVTGRESRAAYIGIKQAF